MNLRVIGVILIMTLCVIDLTLTYAYVVKYKLWQPNKHYKLIERNPLLVYLWNHFSLQLGMLIGAVIILALNYLISKEAHWIVVCLLLGFLIFALFNHVKNIDLLIKLVERYPEGHLPLSIFGVVEGNNKLKGGTK